ncbi:MAG TPA: hypothetical protein VGP99_13740, partial [Tepidisphaeraceae bacterium]|nr:hypothetical protein [Tepidisphaeraceae bacterium]
FRRIIAHPEDASIRQAYADWLEKRADARVAFLRTDPALERINYIDWLEKDGHLAEYIRDFPAVAALANERKVREPLRTQRRALASSLDPDWCAFFNTLACPFEPFLFFNNHGDLQEFKPEDLPFIQRIGTRGSILTFESDFRDEKSWDQGLMRDLLFLTEIQLPVQCYYGAATCPIHPFICQLKTDRHPLRGADILAALQPRAFRSKYIKTLDATDIPYPGYHPGLYVVENDEIHNDFRHQHIFQTKTHPKKDPIDPFSGAHGVFRSYVADDKMWYVLLHTTPQQHGQFQFSPYVILFAIGKSPTGDRLLGVVTHQVCHNLCD